MDSLRCEQGYAEPRAAREPGARPVARLLVEIVHRIASPQDLDRAVMLGLNYPRGPLAMGDAIGPPKLLGVLEAMYDFYKEPRYRPSPWLTRRARLGVSLLTAE